MAFFLFDTLCSIPFTAQIEILNLNFEMAGIQTVCLNNLNINLKNALVVGIIIAKNGPKIFGTKKKSGELRGVTSFTLRDSETDTINCDVWGSEYYVTTLYERFLVGDVGKNKITSLNVVKLMLFTSFKIK